MCAKKQLHSREAAQHLLAHDATTFTNVGDILQLHASRPEDWGLRMGIGFWNHLQPDNVHAYTGKTALWRAEGLTNGLALAQ
jgi:hypothetical protein